MRYRSLGDSGLMVSVTGLGCNNFGRRVDLDGTRAVVDAAIEAGITLPDTPDPVTPVEETLVALAELVAEGRVRYLGHSNFTGWQIADATHVARATGTAPFISAQNHWSLLERQVEAEVVPAARHFGLGVLPYFPLANGLLTGKVRRGQAPPARLCDRRQA